MDEIESLQREVADLKAKVSIASISISIRIGIGMISNVIKILITDIIILRV